MKIISTTSRSQVMSLSPVDQADAKTTSMNVTSVTPATTFTLFPELPAELRIKIYEMMEPKDRVLGMYKVSNATPRDRQFWIHNTLAPPVTLAICAEARYETLKRYKPFGDVRTMYISPKKDVIYVTPRSPIPCNRTHYATTEDLAKIETIAASNDEDTLFYIAHWLGQPDWTGEMKNILPNLKFVKVISCWSVPNMDYFDQVKIVPRRHCKACVHPAADNVQETVDKWSVYVAQGAPAVEFKPYRVVGGFTTTVSDELRKAYELVYGVSDSDDFDLESLYDDDDFEGFAGSDGDEEDSGGDDEWDGSALLGAEHHDEVVT